VETRVLVRGRERGSVSLAQSAWCEISADVAVTAPVFIFQEIGSGKGGTGHTVAERDVNGETERERDGGSGGGGGGGGGGRPDTQAAMDIADLRIKCLAPSLSLLIRFVIRKVIPCPPPTHSTPRPRERTRMNIRSRASSAPSFSHLSCARSSRDSADCRFSISLFCPSY
jgi:hypothetical protein